ncbi:MAG TPA: SPOR domain-containing protein [Thiotrichales bacterium]|nr:SPOR domain-containing protein [Thiotrichales bacterium]
MPADYKPRKKRKQKKSMPGYLWLLAGLAIGLFIAFIVYLEKQPASTTSFETAVNQELKKLKKNNRSDKKTETPAATEPKYNFYTILKGMEVLIPESETRPPEVTKKPPAKSGTRQYILQAGSFQNLHDAEKLKAKLAFLGLEADIQHVTVNNQAWHRVRTGPYKNTQQLFQSKKILQQNNIDAISMELK